MAAAQRRCLHREHPLKKQELSSFSDNALRGEILAVLTPGAPLRLDDIMRRLGLARRAKRAVLETLRGLADEGLVIHLRGGAWTPASRLKRLRGILSVQRSGAAFVRPENTSGKRPDDIFIAPGELGEAWDGDTVEISLFPRPNAGAHGRRAGLHAEGRVLAVLERPRRQLTARVLRCSPPAHPLASSVSAVLCRPADPRLDMELLVDVSGLPHPPAEGELLRVTAGDRLDTSGSSPGLSAANSRISRRREHPSRRKGVFRPLPPL